MNANRPTDVNLLSQTIEQQLHCAETLVTTLEQERQALLSNQMEALEQVSAAKYQAATQLQSLSATLQRVHNDSKGIENAIRQCAQAQSVTLMSRWNELKRVAAQCQKSNLSNGALLEERQSQMRWAQRALNGGQVASTYGRSGSENLQFGGRRLASA